MFSLVVVFNSETTTRLGLFFYFSSSCLLTLVLCVSTRPSRCQWISAGLRACKRWERYQYQYQYLICSFTLLMQHQRERVRDGIKKKTATTTIDNNYPTPWPGYWFRANDCRLHLAAWACRVCVTSSGLLLYSPPSPSSFWYELCFAFSPTALPLRFHLLPSFFLYTYISSLGSRRFTLSTSLSLSFSYSSVSCLVLLLPFIYIYLNMWDIKPESLSLSARQNRRLEHLISTRAEKQRFPPLSLLV